MDTPTIEDEAREARKLIQQAQIKVRDAGWIAQENKDYELSKVLGAVDQTLAGVVGLLICAPRLKG